MELTEVIKATYENYGFAVLDITPIAGTPYFEMEFINGQGIFKKPVITFFMIPNEQSATNQR